jgi:hypothetical protein
LGEIFDHFPVPDDHKESATTLLKASDPYQCILFLCTRSLFDQMRLLSVDPSEDTEDGENLCLVIALIHSRG